MRKFAAVVIAAITVSLTGCGGGSHPPYHTLAKPSLPTGVPAPQCPAGNNHSMGQCLPRREGNVSPKFLSLPSGISCIDLSNNDPVYGLGAWRAIRRHGIRCAIFKVNESTGFVDRTAAPMAAAAKGAGVLVGGYDFQHVCGASATGEAHVFSVYLRQDGLLGPNTVAPSADSEYGNGGCGGHSWELSWRSEVQKETGRVPQTYTGAWWWNPNMGAFNPGGFKWVSGYGVSWPYMPAGWHLDSWQWTDAGYNGINHSDLSLFLDGETGFRSYTNQSSGPVYPVCFHHRIPSSRCSSIKKQILVWKNGAIASSTRVYNSRHCSVFAQRVIFFSDEIRKQPRGPRTASRKRALAASQRVYQVRHCSVFASRVSYYSELISRTKASN